MTFAETLSIISDICTILAFVLSLIVADSIRKIHNEIKKFKAKSKNNSSVNQAGRDINIGG